MAKKVVSKKTEAVKAAVESKTEAAAETIAAKPETEKVAAPQKSVSEPETVSVSEPEAAPVKKAPAKKSASKKEAAADKEAANKEAANKEAANKEAAAPSMPHPEVFVQYYGKEASVREIISNIRKAWTEETGKDASEMKDLKIYIKPEENVAYYVIDEQTRSISL